MTYFPFNYTGPAPAMPQAPTADQIAAAVWDARRTDHAEPGTFGEQVPTPPTLNVEGESVSVEDR